MLEIIALEIKRADKGPDIGPGFVESARGKEKKMFFKFHRFNFKLISALGRSVLLGDFRASPKKGLIDLAQFCILKHSLF